MVYFVVIVEVFEFEGSNGIGHELFGPGGSNSGQDCGRFPYAMQF